MKQYIEKIKEAGPEHSHKMARILAGVSTAVIVVIWIVLVSVFNTQQDTQETVEPSNGPNIQDFLEQADRSFSELDTQYQQAAENYSEVVDDIEAQSGIEENLEPQN